MQAIARWGNFFNQELYGPPTTLPWGIPIDCAHRIAAYPCGTEFPESTTCSIRCSCTNRSRGRSARSFLIWLGYHARKRLRPGDLLLAFFVWYGIVRFTLETFRADNWTFFGVPTAQIVSLLFVIPALVILGWRHRPGHPDDDPPTHPEGADVGRARARRRRRRLDDDDEDDDEDDDDDDDDEDDDDEADADDDDDDDDEAPTRGADADEADVVTGSDADGDRRPRRDGRPRDAPPT